MQSALKGGITSEDAQRTGATVVVAIIFFPILFEMHNSITLQDATLRRAHLCWSDIAPSIAGAAADSCSGARRPKCCARAPTATKAACRVADGTIGGAPSVSTGSRNHKRVKSKLTPYTIEVSRVHTNELLLQGG